jgi:hypothetical protein
MLRRIVTAMICAGLLVSSSGCIELTQVITLNPDGRGKMRIDILQPGEMDFQLMDGQGAKEKTLDEKKHAALLKFLAENSKGVTAWKDVVVKWAADGRLHLGGTRYFDSLEDIQKSQDGSPVPDSSFNFKFTKNKDGTIKLVGKKDGQKKAKKKDLPDLTKMTDKELDEHILKERVAYQATKPILVAFLSDFKIKMEMHLPGQVVAQKGFKQSGEAVVSFQFDGNELLAGMKKFMAQDNATLKKFLKEKNQPELMELFGDAVAMDLSLTIRPFAKAQFDYDREVKEARAAYPKLRKQLDLDENTKLPGEAP